MLNRFVKALRIANDAHAEQLDKAGEPYILHPMRVALEFGDEKHRIVGLLHDAVEDGHITLNDVEAYFDEEIRDAVDALTRREFEDGSKEKYMDFIRRCSLNQIGRRVKLMDIKDNRRPERYQPTLTGLQGRYIKAQAFLVDALKDGSQEDVQFLYDKGLIAYDEYKVLTSGIL